MNRLEGGALTYAAVTAMASGNPAVMEKVKVDTEIRKLDRFRARTSTSSTISAGKFGVFPERIAESHKTLANLRQNVMTHDSREGAEWR
jgi:hypothetical protein